MKKVILTIVISQFMVIGLYAQFGSAQCVYCKGNTIGNYSGAIGVSNTANGESSFASGTHNTSTGDYSTSLGYYNNASGMYSLAGGEQSIASGKRAFAFGQFAEASGSRSLALGKYVTAFGGSSVAIGRYVSTSTSDAMVIGYGIGIEQPLVNGKSGSLMIGFNSDFPTLYIERANNGEQLGKIGIGTIEPSELLEINGTFKVNNWSYMNNIDLDGSDIINIEVLKGQDGLKFRGAYSGGTQMLLTGDGNLGLGTTAPTSTFHIENAQPSMQLRSLTPHVHNGIFINHSGGGGQYEWFAGTPEGDAGKFMIASKVTASHNETTADLANAAIVIEKHQGQPLKVGIGTSDFQEGYLLTIAGKIITEEIKIEHPDQWYDFVFDEGYDLPKLSDLDNFIKQNKHLPDVPTAEDVAENGYELGKMNGILLKKVEELTLYVIEQQKAFDEQQKEIEILKEKVGSLQ